MHAVSMKNRQESRRNGGIEDDEEAMEAHWFGEGVGDYGLEESEDGRCRHLSPLLYVVQNLKHRNRKKTKNCTIRMYNVNAYPIYFWAIL